MGKAKRGEGYRVKDILDFKEVDGQEYLLIWWDKYAKRDATWEPRENIEHVYDFNQYYNKLKGEYEQRNKQPAQLKQEKQERDPKESDKQDEAEEPEESSERPPKRKPISKPQPVKKERKPSSVFYDDSSENPPQPVEQVRQQFPVPQLAQPIVQITTSQAQAQPQPQPQLQNQVEKPNVQTEKEKEVQRQKVRQEKKEIKRLLKEAKPENFQIRVKEFRDLPLINAELRRIKGAFLRDGRPVYEVEIEGKPLHPSTLIDENYMRVLWPKQFAEFLLSHATE